MKKFIRLFTIALATAIVLSFAIPEDAYARRGSSSRSFSRSSSSRSSSRTSSRSASSRYRKSGSSFSTRRRSSSASSTRKTSAADRKLASKAKSQGTHFSSRKEATSAFKSKYGSQYGSKYGSKPSSRPSHIPQNTMVGGTSYPVSYNTNLGGYGYYSSGRWMLYDTMRDVAMMNMLMNRHSYYGERQVVHRGGGGGSFWGSFFSGLMGFLIFLVIVGVGISLISRGI